MVNLNRQRIAVYAYLMVVLSLIFGLSFTVEGNKITGSFILETATILIDKIDSFAFIVILLGFLVSLVFSLFVIRYMQEIKKGVHEKNIRFITGTVVVLLVVLFGFGFYTNDNNGEITNSYADIKISIKENKPVSTDTDVFVSSITGFASHERKSDFTSPYKPSSEEKTGIRYGDHIVRRTATGFDVYKVKDKTESLIFRLEGRNVKNGVITDPIVIDMLDRIEAVDRRSTGVFGFGGKDYVLIIGRLFEDGATYTELTGPAKLKALLEAGYADILSKRDADIYFPKDVPLEFEDKNGRMVNLVSYDGNLYIYDKEGEKFDLSKPITLKNDPGLLASTRVYLKDWKRLPWETKGEIAFIDKKGNGFRCDDETCNQITLTAAQLDAGGFLKSQGNFKVNPITLEVFKKDDLSKKVDFLNDKEALQALIDLNLVRKIGDNYAEVLVGLKRGIYTIKEGKLDKKLDPDKEEYKKAQSEKRRKDLITQIANKRAYELVSNLLNLLIGEYVDEAIKDVCTSEYESSEPAIQNNYNPGPAAASNFDSQTQTTNNCVGDLTTTTAQAQKTTLASGFTYITSWTITPCKENVIYDIYLANTLEDRVGISTGVANKGITKSETIQSSQVKDYSFICIQVSDNSIGDEGYACFNIV